MGTTGRHEPRSTGQLGWTPAPEVMDGEEDPASGLKCCAAAHRPERLTPLASKHPSKVPMTRGDNLRRRHTAMRGGVPETVRRILLKWCP
jgi:hypothetical protein